MSLGFIHAADQREHQLYIGRHMRLPLRPPKAPKREDAIFAELRRVDPNPPQTKRWITQWISKETWNIIDAMVSLRRDPTQDQAHVRVLGRQIQELLNRGRRRQEVESGAAVKPLFASNPPLVK